MKKLFMYVVALVTGLMLLLSVFDLISLSAAPQRNLKRSSHSGFSVTITGSGSPRYNPQRSGPGVMIRFNNINFLVDMGNGTQANLFKAGLIPGNMNALMFTHHHLDHNEEFLPIFISNILKGHHFLITGPQNTLNLVESLKNLYTEDINYRLSRRNNSSQRNRKNRRSQNSPASNYKEISDHYQVKELKGGASFVYEGVSIRTASMNHSIDTIAYRFDVKGKSVVISGDTAYTPNLGVLAKNADVLVMDSGRVIREKNGNSLKRNSRRNSRSGRAGKRRNTAGNGKASNSAHGSLSDVAKMAAEANVKKIVLTHIGPGSIDKSATKKEIRKLFNGEIVFAYD
ncbi:MAG: hypothetical protein GY757_11740, partial [bacterium]|nr:hypothetical protein [bacterium]